MLAALYDSVTQNEIKIIPDNSSGLQIDRIKTLSLSFTRFFFLYHLRGGGRWTHQMFWYQIFFFSLGSCGGGKKSKGAGVNPAQWEHVMSRSGQSGRFDSWVPHEHGHQMFALLWDSAIHILCSRLRWIEDDKTYKRIKEVFFFKKFKTL